MPYCTVLSHIFKTLLQLFRRRQKCVCDTIVMITYRILLQQYGVYDFGLVVMTACVITVTIKVSGTFKTV
jgi:hypothetical protein